ncbi:glucose 1-dehydrogenase [Sphingomonas aquatica]|uniref:glucose 1-dehydrogenase n=1 Tax=Sphingomonas aquatica TaxID=1763824 RepID=UPI000830F088
MVTPLAGQVALISGAAKGIGLATATRLARDGADIVALDLAGSDVSALAAAVAEAGRGLEVVEGDVSTPEGWDAAVAAAVARFGGIDILVNNAGISGPFAPIERYPIEDFDRVMAVNARGSWLGIRACIPELRKRKGRVVNISSTAGLGGPPTISGYTMSKHAVIGLTKMAAMGLAADGIRVNAVCPSPTDTDMMRGLEVGRSDAEARMIRARFEADCPLGRYAAPEEIAAAIAFLAGPESSFVTGAILSVDGGVKAR